MNSILFFLLTSVFLSQVATFRISNNFIKQVRNVYLKAAKQGYGILSKKINPVKLFKKQLL